MKNENTNTIEINVIAYVNIFNYKMVNLVRLHESPNSPKQFEDKSGNLWFTSELSNFTNLNK